MNTEFQQKMAIVAGHTQQKKVELTQADKKKISVAYYKLFFALSMTMWLRGKTLGAAWHTALAQMKSYVESKNKNNPAAMYLNQVFVAHSTKWQQVMMTSLNKDEKLKLTPETQADWMKKTAQRTNDALKTLGETLKQHEPKQPQKAQVPQMMNAQQKMQLLILQHMNQKQHAA